MSRAKKGGSHRKGNPNPNVKKTRDLYSPSRAYYDEVERMADVVVEAVGEHLVVKSTHIHPLYDGDVFQGIAITLLNYQPEAQGE